MGRSLFFITTMTGSAWAVDNPYSWMIWQGPGEAVIMRIIISIVVVGLAFLVYLLIRHTQGKKKAKHFYYTQFLKTAQHFELSAPEIQKLKQVLRHTEIEEPEMILRYVQLYETCIDKEIKYLLKSNVSLQQQHKENEVLYGIRKKLGFHRLPEEQPLMSSRNIALGQAGSLYGRDHTKPLFQRAVVTDSNEFTFSLEVALDRETPFTIAAKDTVKYVFTRKNDGMYGMLLTVVSVPVKGECIVNHTMDMRRNQLRQHVRVEVALPMQLRLLRSNQPEKSGLKTGELVPAKMLDISGGGMCLLCERRCLPGDAIGVSFDLPNGKFSGIAARVLRVNEQEGKTARYFKHHVQFVQLETRKRELIVKFVFEKQRQLNQWR